MHDSSISKKEDETDPSISPSEADAFALQQTQLAEKDQVIQTLTAELEEIKSSTAWSVIQSLWRIRVLLIPHGSRRERAAYILITKWRNVRQDGLEAEIIWLLRKVKQSGTWQKTGMTRSISS